MAILKLIKVLVNSKTIRGNTTNIAVMEASTEISKTFHPFMFKK